MATGTLFTQYGGNVYELIDDTGAAKGVVFYDAGVIAVSSSFFPEAAFSGSTTQYNTIISGTLDQILSGALCHLSGAIYQSVTQLHSTIYACNLGFKEFNYTSNASAVDTTGRLIVTKASNAGVVQDSQSYVTGVNLYNDNNELLACGKLSYPLKKDSAQQLTLRIRLDY